MREKDFFKSLGQEVGSVVDEKNAIYGDAVTEVGKVLLVLYPDGIPTSQYENVGVFVRIFDKMMRIAHGKPDDEDDWTDIAGYSLLKKAKEQEKKALREINATPVVAYDPLKPCEDSPAPRPLTEKEIVAMEGRKVYVYYPKDHMGRYAEIDSPHSYAWDTYGEKWVMYLTKPDPDWLPEV